MDCPKHLNYIYDGFFCPFSADGLIPLQLANAKLADLNKKEQQKNCIPGGSCFCVALVPLRANIHEMPNI